MIDSRSGAGYCSNNHYPMVVYPTWIHLPSVSPLAVRMTKVCYLGDYRQFLSARAARQIEGPILPRWAERMGTQSFSCAGLLPVASIRSPSVHPACLSVWPLGARRSTRGCPACQTPHGNSPAAPVERRGGRQVNGGRQGTFESRPH